MEVEMTGLLVHTGLWKAYLKRYQFDVCVDQAAVVQIMKAKTEQATPCLMCLLDRLSPYSFNVELIWEGVAPPQ